MEKVKECFFGYLSNKDADIACHGIAAMSDVDKTKLALALLESIPVPSSDRVLAKLVNEAHDTVGCLFGHYND